MNMPGVLCPTIMISFIAECVSGMFIVAKKMKAVLIWQTEFLIITVLSLFIGYIISADMKVVLICFAVGRSLVYLINLRMTYSFAKGQ